MDIDISLVIRIIIYVFALILEGMSENEAIKSASSKFDIGEDTIKKFIK
ncbi:MAG: hypothetical protein PHX70_00625 [Clostridium sp.]|nr:hypothetical protein [Clostridium sp.]